MVFQMTCDGRAKMLNTKAVTGSPGSSDLGTEDHGCRVANDIVSIAGENFSSMGALQI